MKFKSEPAAARHRVVVLGANGFLGGAVVHAAASAGHQVVAVSRSGNEASPHENIEFRLGDLTIPGSLDGLLQPGDVVYHFAAATDPRIHLHDPAAEFQQSVAPLIQLIKRASDAGIAKLVYPSSGGTVYADSTSPRCESSRLEPITPYAIFKITAEHLLGLAAREQQFSVDIYRVANPYGPGQKLKPGQGVLPHWIHAIRNHRPITIFGDGSMSRDYIYIDDATRLMLTSMDRIDASGCFNLGSGQQTSLNDLAECLQQVSGQKVEIDYQPSRSGEIQHVVLNIDRLRSIVGPIPFTSLDDGLARMWQLG
jgi:UDP-glucose 4-epimerase